MSDQEQLPVCLICETYPIESHSGMTCECAADGCPMRGWTMSIDHWRRTMSRPLLAPEHVEALRNLRDYAELLDLQKGSDAISAALLALGEE